MNRVVCALLVSISAAAASFAQTSSIQTGFAVITPIAGNGQGLTVSATFGAALGGNVSQASVLPSPLVTLTHVFVRSDAANGLNTGIAVVNPNNGPAAVALSLLNQQGVIIGAQTVTIEGGQQLSRFVTELFADVPQLNQVTNGSLFVNSSLPLGVMGLSFNGPSFSSLPVATQLSSNSVVTASDGTTVPFPTTTIVAPRTFVFSNTPSPAPVTGLVVTQPVTGVATPLVNSTAATASPANTVTTGNTVGTQTTFVGSFPQIAAGVGGNGALLLAQIAEGGGWTTQISIANTSSVSQTVRVDFFNASGGPLFLPGGDSIPSVVIPPGGVVTLSTSR